MAEEEHTTPTQTQRDDIDLSSSQSSTGKKAIGDEKDPLEEMNSMDDDLFSLLNNFPSQMPMPECSPSFDRNLGEMRGKFYSWA
ncbi:transcription factor MYB101-like [Senna tora]|uniref:Transcription factor MYB101-like n=1 Tax=Senna tora TaxID=362788 RepID=A0A834X8C6_9FABA|nr:transcription factor MYB101-like [Senna tora]